VDKLVPNLIQFSPLFYVNRYGTPLFIKEEFKAKYEIVSIPGKSIEIRRIRKNYAAEHFLELY